jgi:hypothetical protein
MAPPDLQVKVSLMEAEAEAVTVGNRNTGDGGGGGSGSGGDADNGSKCNSGSTENNLGLLWLLVGWGQGRMFHVYSNLARFSYYLASFLVSAHSVVF